MSSFIPMLELAPGEVDPMVGYPTGKVGSDGNQIIPKLSKLHAALVEIEGHPEQRHLVHEIGASLYEKWPATAEQEEAVLAMEGLYPKFTFPSWWLYRIWREEKIVDPEVVNTNYGFCHEGVTDYSIASEPLKEFTFFSAMLRNFGDEPWANHLELRTPNVFKATYRLPQLGTYGYENVLSSRGPSRVSEYPALWLPQLANDKGALEWHEKRVNDGFQELQNEEAEAHTEAEAERIAASALTDEAQARAKLEEEWQQMIGGTLKDLKGLGEAA